MISDEEVDMVPLSYFLGVAAILFSLGLAGVLLRRNILIVLMSIELMLNAANFTLLAFARAHGESSGQGFAFFIMALAAAEAAIGLAIFVAVFRTRRTVNITELRIMKN